MSDVTWQDAYDTREEYERDMAADDAYWRPTYQPVFDLDAYAPNDPKRIALDPGFDPDLIRDIARGK